VPSPTIEPLSTEQEREELHTVLRSPLFLRSPALAHLLTYVCEKAFAGEGEKIKEYSIAVDVFGRSADFDQDTDSIVRVEANRLRKRLAEYYKSDGVSHRMHITIPVGQYIPVFERPVLDSRHQNLPITPAPDGISRTPRWRGFWLILIPIGLTVALAVIALLWSGRERNHVRVTTPRPIPVSSEPPVGLPVGEEFRILAGSNRGYVDRSGKQWNADAFFTGGAAVRSSVQHIWRTQDPIIYRTSRQGDFTYNIPLKAGSYELHLHFAETFYGPEDAGGGGEGSRIITVTANGQPLLTNFDVLSDCGGGRTSDVKVFTAIHPASDGFLHLNFSSVKGGRGMVSAIEILPGLDSTSRPVRIVARDVPYYSDDSRWWSSDIYFKGGQLRASEESAAGTDDPELYAGERWGNFSYAIPVPAGKYTVTLHFVERTFQAVNHGGSFVDAGISSERREFSIYCNHRPIIRDLDILAEAGDGRALVKKISGLEPDAQGKLLLEFIPSQNYATVSAIEVTPQ
jgi:hypothetical protein